MSESKDLTGMFYLTRGIKIPTTQGIVERKLSPGRYVVQPFSFLPTLDEDKRILGINTYALCGKYVFSIEQVAMEGIYCHWEFFETEDELVERLEALGPLEMTPLGPPGCAPEHPLGFDNYSE